MTNEFVDGRPLCTKGLHFLDTEGATYRRSDGRTGCTACKKSRAKRSRQRAKEKREAAERRARLREEQKAVRQKPKPPPKPDPTVLNPAAVPPGVGVGGQKAARYRLAQMVRASRGRT